MAATRSSERKQSFSTRISPETLAMLDRLVRSGHYPNRTVAIEAAVAQLASDTEERLEGRQAAFNASCGALSLGIDANRMREARLERLDWLGERLGGG
ncbi:MAG: hypothetical protein HW416_1110 [Chloroflexi bacterium]|nr:hypothetical protein [Chloroflexota bacterium]